MEQEQIKEIVIKEIAKTERLIKEYRDMSGPVEPDDAIGRITRMDAINNKSVTESSLRQAEEKLKNLDRVLSKVGTKEFGICQKCGQEIHIRRILFRPESLLCVNCAT
jgi:DnaK suppressor protein